ncbi:hypothetical protein MHK_002917, partial [Candidatus Magnetomorum sp. HK-1]
MSFLTFLPALNSTKKDWIFEEVIRVTYRYLCTVEEGFVLKGIVDENGFVQLIYFITKKIDVTIQVKIEHEKVLKQILTSIPLQKAIKESLFEDLPKMVDLFFGNFNAIGNMMNSLTDENNVLEAAYFLIKQYLVAQLKQMVREGVENSTDYVTELLAKQLGKVLSNFLPGTGVLSLASKASDIGTFAYDAGMAPKYVPVNVTYDNVKKELAFSQPQSCSFSELSFLAQVPKDDLSDSSLNNNLEAFLLDNYEIETDQQTNLKRIDITSKPATLMHRYNNQDVLFYHQFFIGEKIDLSIFKIKIDSHPVVSARIIVNSFNKGDLIPINHEKIDKRDLDLSKDIY